MMLKANLKYQIDDVVSTIDHLISDLQKAREALLLKNEPQSYLNISDKARKTAALEIVAGMCTDHVAARCKWVKEQLWEE